MDKHRAIPPGYMTVGEVAKKMNTTVRTLQYYDKEGVLSPSAESEGGRRLYTDKDIIKLHQIQSMKYLGFSLDDIKNRLIFLDTPADVADMLNEHAANVRDKITALSEELSAIETLKDEVMAMQTVDFRKYADIIVNLQMKNEYYSIIKYLDNTTIDVLRNRYDTDGAAVVIKEVNLLLDTAIQYQKDGIRPESKEGQELAKTFWDKMLEVTGGDVSMIVKMAEVAGSRDGSSKWKTKQDIANSFIEPALGAYFSNIAYNPFEGVAP